MLQHFPSTYSGQQHHPHPHQHHHHRHHTQQHSQHQHYSEAALASSLYGTSPTGSVQQNNSRGGGGGLAFRGATTTNPAELPGASHAHSAAALGARTHGQTAQTAQTLPHSLPHHHQQQQHQQHQQQQPPQQHHHHYGQQQQQQQQHHHHHLNTTALLPHHLQHPAPPSSLSLPSSSALVPHFNSQSHQLLHLHHQHHHNNNLDHSRSLSHAVDTMADDQQQQQQYSEQDLANLQKLSAQYEPEITGPMVSKRLSTTSITSEYANADPVYQTKTAALPQKFHEYRTVRGDGHCGWRAVAFTYFETLQRLGDLGKFDEELARISSMRNLLEHSGYDRYMWEDFEAETLECLQRTRDAVSTNDDGLALLNTFNDESMSMSIITHLKLLASSWMKTHVADFEPYLDNMTVPEYCSNHLDPVQSEMDDMSLNALYSILVKPAGINLEVMYLDRSIGSEINTHRFEVDGDVSGPVIHLLYRPGHYDILYRIPPQHGVSQAPLVPQSDVYVGLMSRHDQFIPRHQGGPDVLTLLPGMSGPSYMQGGCWGQNVDFTPSPVSAIPGSYMQPLPSYNAPPPTPSTPSVPHAQDYALPPISAAGLQSSMELPLRGNMSNGGPFRPSMYTFDGMFGGMPPPTSTCQTSIFRNSHFNTAHYLNPEFEPEQWDPSQEYATTNSHRVKQKP